MGGPGRTLLSLSLFSNLFFRCTTRYPSPNTSLSRVFLGFKPLCSTTTTTNPTSATTPIESEFGLEPNRHTILLEKLRIRHLKDSAKPQQPKTPFAAQDEKSSKKSKPTKVFSSFREMGLSEEVLGTVDELGITMPTEIQCLGIPAVLEGESVVLGSHTGSGKTLAYMLPLVQLLRRDEELYGMLMKPRRPRAVVLCPTRELCEQVFRVAKSVSHHARFRSTMVSGGGRMRPQEDSLNIPLDMVVGTPGRVLQHIEDGNLVYGDIKYLVLDEADTMFDRGFGPDIRKFLSPLKNRASKSDDQGFQTVLVTATMTLAVRKLIDEEFEGIVHLRTSTLHKKIASARHDFIILSGSENKLEALLQVLEPSLAKGNRVMVFCNTLNSSRAVDHFLGENKVFTVNYHGEVPAEQRVENLKKFKSEDGDCPTLVCTDLAARGLDLDVDHVIMFDFPSNAYEDFSSHCLIPRENSWPSSAITDLCESIKFAVNWGNKSRSQAKTIGKGGHALTEVLNMDQIDYLHRTGRTARMGAKGKVTSLVAKRDQLLASRIDEAITKNESLESLTAENVRRDVAKSRTPEKGKNADSVKRSYQKNRTTNDPIKSSGVRGKKVAAFKTAQKKTFTLKAGKTSSPTRRSSSPINTKRTVTQASKPFKSTSARTSSSPGERRPKENRKSGNVKSTVNAKLNVVGFRGKSSSSSTRESSRHS
ncbi:hypothetical protein GIB67_028563 [Kingdonia uniflora]|uniref:DEAD-box ATP-dependent RNA helicase 39 n=1 Tax=Kingdonia uniflora TaxID=39325 RepID=A0A7J7NVI2_9MAGN|nr:hypothetical protein GIB67_028563 [Kingdonia uniflora]